MYNRTFSCHSLTSRCLYYHGALSHFRYSVIFVFFSLFLVELPVLGKKNPRWLILGDHFVIFKVTEMSFLNRANITFSWTEISSISSNFFLSQHNGIYDQKKTTLRWYSIWFTSLTYSPFQTCRTGDMKKLHYVTLSHEIWFFYRR